jgi:hypothetical protein
MPTRRDGHHRGRLDVGGIDGARHGPHPDGNRADVVVGKVDPLAIDPDVSSVLGQGTTFFIRLPIASRVASQRGAA